MSSTNGHEVHPHFPASDLWAILCISPTAGPTVIGPVPSKRVAEDAAREMNIDCPHGWHVVYAMAPMRRSGARKET